MLAALLNGQPIDSNLPIIHMNDRGWQYGDGVFETMLLKASRVRFWQDHVQRLQEGCERLRMPPPSQTVLQQELALLIGKQTDGVVKFILTRGRGGRGYRPDPATTPTRVWQLFPALSPQPAAIALRCCDTRLSRNSLLAGIKHLNRLEQVLAQAEWDDTSIAEGLLLDTEGELVCGTMSNLFLVLDGVLVTPDLRYSGVRGVMRKNVLQLASTLNMVTEERAVWPQELTVAQEVFITNALRGIKPVVALRSGSEIEQQWGVGEITAALLTAVDSVQPRS